MFIKPVPGKKVRYPDRDKFLSEEGAQVSDTDLFWRKRIKQGDVVVTNPQKNGGK